MIAYRLGNRAVFIYGLAKSDQDNFAEIDLKTAREIASIWIPARQERIALGIQAGELVEVINGEEGIE